MSERTSLVLDRASRAAAVQLARHYRCGMSEAIRRAVVNQRDAVIGVGPEVRRQRRRVLEQLFDLFEGADPESEIKRLKQEDAGF